MALSVTTNNSVLYKDFIFSRRINSQEISLQYINRLEIHHYRLHKHSSYMVGQTIRCTFEDFVEQSPS
jgi:hypothetical protein